MKVLHILGTLLHFATAVLWVLSAIAQEKVVYIIIYSVFATVFALLGIRWIKHTIYEFKYN